WRCLDCDSRPTFCTACCRKKHNDHLFHRVEVWTGTCFRPAWIQDLGVQLHCGHGGVPCP
ncbi:uncharacterized protein BXZ73DRAFT_11685, partial [Epithele typhae]|uniref:uncharacterized protein n=1 Tax=Epithele typhae TaxID=378194 RepID=UPI002007ADE1